MYDEEGKRASKLDQRPLRTAQRSQHSLGESTISKLYGISIIVYWAEK